MKIKLPWKYKRPFAFAKVKKSGRQRSQKGLDNPKSKIQNPKSKIT
jgi:hypothetical protein